MIVGIVLGAGLARRMGRPKLLMDFRGAPVLRHTVERVMAAVNSVIVVVGPSHAPIEAALRGLPVHLAINPTPEAGQGTSIRAGVAALPPETRAALIALGDQPTVSPRVIRALVETLRPPGNVIAAPRYRDGRGNPVLFAATVFSELLALAEDEGARSVLERDPRRLALVPVDEPMPPDIDTPEDYERLKLRGNPV